MTPAPRKALRVSQLDVEDLDASFTKTIFESFNDCFKYTYILQPGSLTNLLAKSCLYSVVTYVTLVKSGQTVGQQILGLRFFKLCFYILTYNARLKTYFFKCN